MRRKGIHLDSLHLREFTTFSDATFQFCPGVNAFVGENGTGKTHAMKVLYAFMLAQTYKDAVSKGFLKTLLETMQTDSEVNLVRAGADSKRADIQISYGDRGWQDALFADGRNHGIRAEHLLKGVERPVFIPAVDMLGHARNFVQSYDEYALDFDYTFRDLAHLLSLERRAPAPQYNELIGQLETVLDGKVVYDAKERRFFLVRGTSRQEMPMVAEGLRKIATLLVLLRNGSIKQGVTLFWDEPEVNINPILMDEIVKALLVIARSGVQIVLATHSYVILKELDLQARKEDDVRYFAFEMEDSGTRIHETSDFTQIAPNKILEQYSSLYDRELTHSLRRNRNGRRG